MGKTFKERGFKAGDWVVLTKDTSDDYYRKRGIYVGKPHQLKGYCGLRLRHNGYQVDGSGGAAEWRVSLHPWTALTESYLCLCDDDCWIAHEGSLDELPSEVVRVFERGAELKKTCSWSR